MNTQEPDINYISKAADCSVGKFISCLFDSDYSVLVKDKAPPLPTEEQLQYAFSQIHMEFLDLSGISNSDQELDLLKEAQKHSLRIDTIAALLYVQYTSLQHFEYPFKKGVDELIKYGYKLKWRADLEDFKSQLKAIERKELNTQVKFKEAVKKIEDFRKKQQEKKSGTLQNAKVQFKKMIHQLQQEKYVIDYVATPIEDVAIMLSEYEKQCQQRLYN
jgi:hypothetical protein